MQVSRRGFLKGGATAVGAAALSASLPAPGDVLAASNKIDAREIPGGLRITCANGLALDFMIDNSRLRGIGGVSFEGKALRNQSEFIWPEIATPYGREVAHFELLDVHQNDEAIVVSTRPYFRVGHRMDWTEQAVHPLINSSSWSSPPQSPEGSLFEWVIRGVNETIGGCSFRGFSYGFHYRGPNNPIYQIEDKSTWELGGEITGNGFIMRGANTPHTRFARETPLYSGWDFAQSPNPHIFQHKPLYTQLQGFTFQYDLRHVLVTVHEHPSHVRSLYLRRPHEPALLHFNQFCFDLTEESSPPARKILVSERPDGETALANCYLRVRDQLQEAHRKYYGLKYDRTRPVSHLECSGLAQMEKYPAAFEQLRKWGIHRAFIMPIWRSPDTDIKPLFEKQKSRFGIFGNLCCPLELEIADCYGGWQGFQRLMEQAAAMDIEPYIWHASHFSSLTPLLDRIPDLFCRDLAGQYNHNNYGHVLFAVNQRSERYQEYLLNCYRKAKGLGLKGLFHDSHFNLATDTINYLHGAYGSEDRPAGPGAFSYPDELRRTDNILSMHDTALTLQRRLQEEIGMFYYVESEGALGTSMTSPDYEFLRGNEFIYSNMDSAIDLKDLEEFGDDPLMVYFRGLSTRLTYQVSIDPVRFPAKDSVASWWRPEAMVPLNHAFARVEDSMGEMWLLEDDQGVLWKSPDAQVLFAYKDFEMALEHPTAVLDAISGTTSEAGNQLKAKARGIYVLRLS